MSKPIIIVSSPVLTRKGRALVGYVSDNNRTWQRVGTATLTLAETVYLDWRLESRLTLCIRLHLYKSWKCCPSYVNLYAVAIT